MEDYLSKPVKSEVLQRKLQQWIKPASVTLFGRRLSLNRTAVNNRAVAVIDLDVLAGLRELQQPGQPDFVTELIDLFLNDSASQAAILRAAIASNDMPEVRRVAHLMKGSSVNLGATHMAELYQELETLALGIR